MKQVQDVQRCASKRVSGVVQAVQSTGIKKKWGTWEVRRRAVWMHQSKGGGLDDKALPRGGQGVVGGEPIVTLEDGTCMVFNPNYDNTLIMDGDSDNANDIWLRNWREIGLDLQRRRKAGASWCWFKAGRAKCKGRRRAWRRSEGSRSSSYTSTRSRLAPAASSRI